MEREVKQDAGDESPAIPEVPPAPEIDRRIALPRLQWIGLPLLMLLPLLAIFGLFGEEIERSGARGAELALRVEYPARLRYRMAGSLEIAVENIAGRPLPPAAVRIERRYLDAFFEVDFIPHIGAVTEQSYDLELPALAPGEIRRVRVEFQADAYGRHRGAIAAGAGGQPVRLQIETLVFP